MPIPFLLSEVCEINKKLKIEKSTSGNYHYIENFYKNIDLLESIIQNSFVPSWKYVPGSRNFIDYYDCRIQIEQYLEPLHNHFRNLIENRGYDTSNTINNISFNCFSDISGDFGGNIQQHPHVDDGNNLIIPIDKLSKGGTVLYKDEPIPNNEEQDLRYDISYLEVLEVIPSVRNRAIIFDGNILHGAFIEPKTYINDVWRINQVYFI